MTDTKELGIIVTGDIDDVMNSLNQLQSAIQDIPDAVIGVSVHLDEGSVKSIQNELDAIPDVVVGVTAQVDEATIKNVETQLDAIPDGVVNISTQMDEGSLQTLQRELDSIPDNIDINVTANTIGNVTQDVTTLGNDLTDSTKDAENLDHALDGIDATKLNEAVSAASSLGENLSAVSGDATGASTAMEGTAEAAEDVGVGGALAGAGIVAGIGAMVSSAGNYNDQMGRIGVTQDHIGENATEVQNKWGGTMSAMGDATGRGMSTIRKEIADMGNIGVHSTQTITEGFTLMSGAAIASGQPIETVERAYNKVVQTGTLGNRQLASLGLTTDDVLKKTGMTMDQVREKMTNMNSEQRAAFLNNLMDTEKNRAGVEEYKVSWEHLTDSVGRAIEYFSRIFGALLLPIAIPAINTLVFLMGLVAGAIDKLDGPIGTAIKIVGGLVLAFTFLVAAIGTLMFAYSKLEIAEIVANARQVISTGYKYAGIIATNLYAIATGDLTAITDLFSASTVTATGVTSGRVQAMNYLTGTTEINTAAENQGIFARARAGAEYVLLTARTWLSATATAAHTAATEAYTFITGGSVLATTGAAAGRAWLAIQSGVATIATGALAVATGILNVIMDANPIMLVVLAIAALVGALLWAYYNIKPVHDAVDGLWKMLTGFWDWLMGGAKGGDVWGWLWNGMKYAFDMVTLPLRIIWDTVQGFISWLTGGGGTGSDGKGLWDWIWKGLDFITWLIPPIAMIKFVVEGLISFLTGKPVGIWEWLWKPVTDAKLWIMAELQFIKLTALKFIQDIINLPRNLWNWIWESLNKVWGQVNTLWTTIYSYVMNMVNKIKAIPQDLFDWVWKSLNKVWGQINTLWTTLYAYVMNMVLKIKSIPQDLFNWIWQGAKSAIDKVFATFKSFTDYLISLPEKMLAWGKSIIDSLVKGIVDAVPGLKEVLKAIGIHFPQSQPQVGGLSGVTPESTKAWTKGLVDSMATGITDGTGGVKTVLEYVAAHFPRSQPTEGGLAPATPGASQAWTKALTDGMSTGIKDGQPGIEGAAQGVSDVLPAGAAPSTPKSGPLSNNTPGASQDFGTWLANSVLKGLWDRFQGNAAQPGGVEGGPSADQIAEGVNMTKMYGPGGGSITQTAYKPPTSTDYSNRPGLPDYAKMMGQDAGKAGQEVGKAFSSGVQSTVSSAIWSPTTAAVQSVVAQSYTAPTIEELRKQKEVVDKATDEAQKGYDITPTSDPHRKQDMFYRLQGYIAMQQQVNEQITQLEQKANAKVNIPIKIDTIGLTNDVQKASDLLPHSPAKEGPLSEVTPERVSAYGTSLMSGMASGISAGVGSVGKALSQVSSALSVFQGTSQLGNVPVPAENLDTVERKGTSQFSSSDIHVHVNEGAVVIQGNADEKVVKGAGESVGSSIVDSVLQGFVSTGGKPNVTINK
jgi:hypothetical protein